MKKRYLRGFLDVLAGVCFVLAVICTLFNRIIFNETAYRDAIITDEFDSAVLDDITSGIDSVYSVTSITSEKILSSVGRDAVIAYEHDYTAAFLSSIVSGKEFVPPEFDSEKISEAVIAEAENYGEVSQEEKENLTEYVNGKTKSLLHFIPGFVTDRLESVSSVAVKIREFTRAEIPLYLAFLLITALNFAFLGKRHREDIAFCTVGAMWIGIATVEIPLLLAMFYNAPSRLALEKNTVYYVLKGLNELLINRPALLLGVILTVLTAALGILAYLVAKKDNRAQKKEFVRIHFEKENEKSV